MSKTPEEIYEYVLDYKNKLLRDKEQGKDRALDSANNADNRLSTQLIFSSTVLLTVIGGLIASGNKIANDGLKVLVTIAILTLLISICCGLAHFVLANRFFKAWGDHLHKQAGLIYKDNSQNVEELEKLLEKLQEQSESMSIKSNPFFSITQATLFIVGVLSVFIVVIVKIYS